MTEITNKELKSFARVISIALVAVFGLFLPWVWEYDWAIWPWVVAGVLMLTSLTRPMLLKWIYLVWHRVAEVIGRINSRIILGLIFYVLITPIAVLLKLIGKQPLEMKGKKHDGSFCQPVNQRDKSHFEKPF